MIFKEQLASREVNVGTTMANTTHFIAYILCYTHIPRLCTLDASII